MPESRRPIKNSMAVVHKCFTSTRPPTPNTGSWERTAVRGHSELVWESLALWCSAWVASFLGWARCHRIPRARRGATMLCTCRAALGQGEPCPAGSSMASSSTLSCHYPSTPIHALLVSA